MNVLTVNAGSSSLRLAAMRAEGGGLRCVAASHRHRPGPAGEALLRDLLDEMGTHDFDAVVHRVVHGGPDLVDACRIDAEVESRIDQLAALAPLHNPLSLAWIRTCRAVLDAHLPHIAVFDTAFYADLPEVARHYALPRHLRAPVPLRRFGFHGLAHQGMLRRWRDLNPDAPDEARVISLQLGSGCSITASRGGRPLETSMGFSPLEGLMMATRSGDIDPGLVLYLQRTLGMTPARMEQLLNDESGLLGVSGISADMSEVLASRHPAARLAVDLYCHRARKYVGACLAVLGGVDAVLFGGGVGENAPRVRAAILADLEWAGIAIDPEANRSAISVDACISVPPEDHPRAATVWTLPVDESVLLAEEALRVLQHKEK